jgi:hypothetical protein
MMPLSLSLTRTQPAREQPCAICGAEFVPEEDSGSRLLSLMPAGQQSLDVLMCGGCHSKWSHGVTVTVRHGSESPLVPVFRHPEGGRAMDGSIRHGDVVVCRVNGTSDLYVIGTVATGTVGELSLSGVTTIEGLAEAIERGYRNRIPEERVWLFDGSASGYVKTSAPRGQLYHG